MNRFTVVSVDSDLPLLRGAFGLPEIRAGMTLDGHCTLGEGAFAEVFSVSLHAAAAAAQLALKRFTPGISDVTRTAALVAQLHARLSIRPPSAWLRSCTGVPFWSGRVCEDGGPPFFALLALDLRAVGYVSLEEILADGCAGLLNLEMCDRIEVARSFAETAALFEDLDLLHSDINPPNLFVDLDHLSVAVIDVDGGALAGKGVPEACGKSDDFLAPELADPTCTASVTVSSERWSYGIAVSYLLLGTHPLFFLRSLGAQVVEEYLDTFAWPEVDLVSNLVNPDVAAVDYPAWRADVEQLPGEVAEHFRMLVAGYPEPSLRPSAWGWALALQSGPPWFEQIAVSAIAIIGEEAIVSWWAPRASTVTIAGMGGLPARGSVPVPAVVSGPIRLVAVNACGTTEGWTDPIIVLRAPPSPQLVSSPRPAPPPIVRLPRLRVPPRR